MNLKFKFFVGIVLVTSAIYIFALIFVNVNFIDYTKKLSIKTINVYSQYLADIVSKRLTADMHTVKAMRDIIQYHAEEKNSLSRNYVLPILKGVLLGNKHFLAVWISEELSFLKHDPYITHGRIRLLVKLDKGRIATIIDTVDVEKENVLGPYYKSKIGYYSSILTNPYKFNYKLKDTITTYLETSLGEPIYYKDKFIGLVGVDVSLKRYNDILKVESPFVSRDIAILSTDGSIVTYSNSKYLDYKLTHIYPALAKYDYLDKIAKGEEFSLTITQSGKQYLFVFKPIIVADKKLPWSLVYIIPYSQIMQPVRYIVETTTLISFAAIFIVFILIYLFSSSLTNRILRVSRVIEDLSRGKISESLILNVRSRDEIGQMYMNTNKLIKSLNLLVEFAREIGKGNLDAYYELKSDDDILGKALIEMKMNLKKMKQEELRREEESKKLSWLQNGITEINEILRLNNESLDDLAFEVLKYLVKYVDANQGGFYIVEEKEDKSKIIRLVVAFAYDRKKVLEAEFEEGEGLIGRAVKEKRMITITNLPQGYSYIRSGLGDETPQNLVIIPLIFENEVYGVIEILSFHKFEKYQIDFLEQAGYRIASSVSNLVKNLQTQRLLEQFRQQSKIIESKEKELNTRIKEVGELKKEVEELKRRYEAVWDTLGENFVLLRYNPDLILIEVNDYFLHMTGIEHFDILGKSIDEILPESKEKPKWFEKFISDLKNGFVRKKTTRYVGKRTVFVDEYYIPIKDENGKVVEIVCIGINVTKNYISKKQ